MELEAMYNRESFIKNSSIRDLEQQIQKESAIFSTYVLNCSKADKPLNIRLSEKMRPHDKRDLDFVFVTWELIEALNCWEPN